MATKIEPYLFFNGRADEAIAFYSKAVGAKTLFRAAYKDAPQPMPKGSIPDGWEEKVMHATLDVRGCAIMVSDGNKKGGSFEGFHLSLSTSTPEEADKAFAALSDGGRVTLPIGKTFWSPRFGMLVDRFGVGWMVTVEERKG